MHKTAISQPRLPITWWGLVIRAFVAVFIMFVSNFVRVPLHQVVAREPEDAIGLLSTSGIFMVTPLVVIVLVVLWVRFVECRPLTTIGLPGWRRILPGLAGGTAVVALPMTCAWLIVRSVGNGGAAAAEGFDSAGMAAAFVVFMLVRSYFLQGIPEELLFRGWLFSTTADRPLFTVGWTTIAFTLPHLFSAGGQESAMDFVIYLILPLGMGIVGGAVVVWKGSFWWAAGTHGGMHAMMALLGFLLPMELNNTAIVALGIANIVTGIAVLGWLRQRPKGEQSFGGESSSPTAVPKSRRGI